MYSITSSFMNMALVWAVIFILVLAFYYFKFRGDVNLSDFDRAFWQFRLFTFFLGALIAIAMLYLPTTGFYSDIDMSASGRETAFQGLVRNQERMGNQRPVERDLVHRFHDADALLSWRGYSYGSSLAGTTKTGFRRQT